MARNGRRSRAHRNGSRARLQRDAEPLVAYDSKLKMAVLSLPCFVIIGSGLTGVITGESLLNLAPSMQWAAMGIAAVTAFTLLQMGFDPKPVLVIDEDGIRCRRPDIGLIPWNAIVSAGTAKAALMRRVLMIAVDAAELDEKARRHVKERVGLFNALSRNVAKFEREMAGHPTIQITLSSFSIPTSRLEAQIEALFRVHAPGG